MIDAALFFEALGLIIKGGYMSNDPLRPPLNGLNLETEGNFLNLVATDGNKLIKIRLPYEGKQTVTDLTIKGQDITDYHKKNQKAQGEISIKRLNNSEAELILNGKSTKLSLETMAYPAYRSAIPIDNDAQLKMSKKDAKESLEMIIPFVDNVYSLPMRIALESNNQVSFNTINAKHNQDRKEAATCFLTAKEVIGLEKGFEIGFNAKFLMEVINSLLCENIRLMIGNPSRAVISPCEQKFETFAILMPILLKDFNNEYA